MSNSAKSLLSKKGKISTDVKKSDPEASLETFGLDNPHLDADIPDPIDPRETEIGNLIVGSVESSRQVDILEGVQSLVGRVLLEVTDPEDLTEENVLRQFKVRIDELSAHIPNPLALKLPPTSQTYKDLALLHPTFTCASPEISKKPGLKTPGIKIKCRYKKVGSDSLKDGEIISIIEEKPTGKIANLTEGDKRRTAKTPKTGYTAGTSQSKQKRPFKKEKLVKCRDELDKKIKALKTTNPDRRVDLLGLYGQCYINAIKKKLGKSYGWGGAGIYTSNYYKSKYAQDPTYAQSRSTKKALKRGALQKTQDIWKHLFDCSGLTKYANKAFGVPTGGEYAAEIARNCILVPENIAKWIPGCMILFGKPPTSKSTSNRIANLEGQKVHVGHIEVAAGDGTTVYGSQGGRGVHKRSWGYWSNGKYWRRIYPNIFYGIIPEMYCASISKDWSDCNPSPPAEINTKLTVDLIADMIVRATRPYGGKWRVSREKAEYHAKFWLDAFPDGDINTPIRAAHFCAQMIWECGHLTVLKEKYNPSQGGAKYSGHPDDIPPGKASRRRTLGNDQPGDGPKFIGRGYIQLTGRRNYKRAGDAIGVDLLNNPELAEKPEIAAKIAVWYWKTWDINSEADKGEPGVKGVTRKINGGYNHLKNRLQYYRRAVKAIK